MNMSVILSTSKYVADKRFSELCGLKNMHFPICIAKMIFLFYNINEKVEHDISQSIKNMAELVSIDSTRKTIYIGKKEKCLGLLDYKEEGNHEQANDFFSLWNKTDCLLFEQQVFIGDTLIFSLLCFWIEDSWLFKKILPGCFFINFNEGLRS